MNQAVIVAMGRSAIGKSGRGRLANTRPDDFASQVLREVLKQIPEVPFEAYDDLIMGCALPEKEQGMNIARNVAMLTGLGVQVPGQTVNRFCSSGLQTIATAANSIIAGQNDVVIAGGAESMTHVPMTIGMYPNVELLQKLPQAYDPMGITAENVAEHFRISRQEQDEFALRSHELAANARSSGKFAEEIIPVQAVVTASEDGVTTVRSQVFDQDEGIREGLTMEQLAKLRPVFRADGSVTAGNSSQTSDGAAFVVMMSEEKARKFGISPIARFAGFSVAGVDPGMMGIGPMYAIPKALKRNGYALKDMDLIELNEAFASQSLACVKELGIEEKRLNVNGGAIAMGHPLGCTGAALTVKLLSELRRRGQKRGLVSMCIGGGMGAAGIFELI